MVNTAARLQASAEAGQIVMSRRLFDGLSERPADATSTMLELKGKHEPEPAWIMDVARAAILRA